MKDFFESLDLQTYKDFELYVVDNNSTDDSLKLAKQFSKGVKFVTKFYPQDTNLGVAKGNNIGIDAAMNDGCEYVLLSNNESTLKSRIVRPH